jgi:hypothetical protein
MAVTGRPEYGHRSGVSDTLKKAGLAMTKISDLHEKWLDDAQYRRAYETLEKEFSDGANDAHARTTTPPLHSHMFVQRLPRKRGRKTSG